MRPLPKEGGGILPPKGEGSSNIILSILDLAPFSFRSQCHESSLFGLFVTSLRLIFLLFPCCDRSCLLLRLARRLCWRMVEQRLVPSRPYRFLAWSFVVVRRLRQHTYSSRRLSLGELSLLCERPCVAHCYTGSLPFARRVCVVPSPLHVSSKRFSVHFDILPWRCAVYFGCFLRLCVLQRLSHCCLPLPSKSSLSSGHHPSLVIRAVLVSSGISVPPAVRSFRVALLHAEVRLLCLLSLFVCVFVYPAGLVLVVSEGCMVELIEFHVSCMGRVLLHQWV